MTRFSKVYTGGLLSIKEEEDFPLLCIAIRIFCVGPGRFRDRWAREICYIKSFNLIKLN